MGTVKKLLWELWSVVVLAWTKDVQSDRPIYLARQRQYSEVWDEFHYPLWNLLVYCFQSLDVVFVITIVWISYTERIKWTKSEKSMAPEYINSEVVRICKCVHVCLRYICARVRERKRKRTHTCTCKRLTMTRRGILSNVDRRTITGW